MIRLFVGLEIADAVARGLALLGGGVPGARWATREQLHLTLRFIGDVDDPVGADIDDALSVLRAPAFTLELAGVGEFGGKKPHALWAGVRANEILLRLQGKIENAIQRIGLEPETRKFAPHVSLARLKNAPGAKVMEFLSAHALYASGPIAVERFVLFSSQLGSGGSVYRVERAYALT